jgi:hypothetical protein
MNRSLPSAAGLESARHLVVGRAGRGRAFAGRPIATGRRAQRRGRMCAAGGLAVLGVFGNASVTALFTARGRGAKIVGGTELTARRGLTRTGNGCFRTSVDGETRHVRKRAACWRGTAAARNRLGSTRGTCSSARIEGCAAHVRRRSAHVGRGSARRHWRTGHRHVAARARCARDRRLTTNRRVAARASCGHHRLAADVRAGRRRTRRVARAAVVLASASASARATFTSSAGTSAYVAEPAIAIRAAGPNGTANHQ